MIQIHQCRCFVLLAASALYVICIHAAHADDPAPGSMKPPRLLFVTKSFGFKHDVVNRKSNSLSMAEQTVVDWGVSSNLFRADCSQDAAKDLTKEILQNYDVVMFYTTGPRNKWPLDDSALEYLFNDWVEQKGHGFIGVHSAADTLADYKPYWEMLGASFNDHPWTSGSNVTVTVHDPDHPFCKPWGTEFTIKDEIYQFKNWQPENVHVLMSLDIGHSVFTPDVNKRVKEPYHIPIAWCKQYGEGKVLYMSLGHNEAVWANARFRDSMLGGIQWVLGQVRGDATPNPEVSAAELEKGKADVAARRAELTNKHSLEADE